MNRRYITTTESTSLVDILQMYYEILYATLHIGDDIMNDKTSFGTMPLMTIAKMYVNAQPDQREIYMNIMKTWPRPILDKIVLLIRQITNNKD